MATLDPNTLVSKYFRLRDLTVTDTGIDNVPDDSQLANLRSLGAVLDRLYETIGPFRIISAFRSNLVNDAVDGVSTSNHMLGRGADIQPTTMTAKEFWGRVLQNPSLRNSLGEIALKNTVIHLSLPSASKVGVPMIVEGGNYVVKSLEDALAFAGKYKTEIGVGLGILAIVAVGVFAWMQARKR